MKAADDIKRLICVFLPLRCPILVIGIAVIFFAVPGWNFTAHQNQFYEKGKGNSEEKLALEKLKFSELGSGQSVYGGATEISACLCPTESPACNTQLGCLSLSCTPCP